MHAQCPLSNFLMAREANSVQMFSDLQISFWVRLILSAATYLIHCSISCLGLVNLAPAEGQGGFKMILQDNMWVG